MMRRTLGLVVLVVLFVALVSNSSGAPPPGTGAPKEAAGPLHATSGDNKEQGLDSRLVALQATSDRHGAAPALAQAKHDGMPVRGGGVVVTIEATSSTAGRRDVAAVQGEVERTSGRLIRAVVPPGRLRALARSSGVRDVRPPLQPVADAVAGEGVGATNAAAWQALGRTGTGAKVAIIDLGFAGYTSAQANGDLPAVTTVNYCTPPFPGAEQHGTAVAEVVHEMAPDAALTLICIEDETSLAQAEAYVKAHGITIVNHSVGWWGTASRGDGTGAPGTPDAIVADARANGVLWVNSAGNYAQRHWSGAFNDTNGDRYHDFAAGDSGNSFWVPSGGNVCVSLKWDSWPTTAQDFDLYVGRSSDGALVASSTNLQNGTQPPLEGACFTNGGADDWFYAAIYKFAATAKPSFDLFVFGDAYDNSTANIQYPVASRSLLDPASSPNALAAGALCWQTSALEPYSSRGPTIDNRVKPDIAGPDSVSGYTYGPFSACGQSGFSGTSASAPHVAGAAALVAGLHPLWTPTQIQTFLTSSAQDLGAAGNDNLYGAGRLRLTIGAAPVVKGFTPTAAPVGTTVKVTGTNLASATSVLFNGVAATPVSSAATTVTAVVPAGATTGTIQVQTPDGTGLSATVFKVSPKITGFAPASANRGDAVTITGFNFTAATSVKVGSVAASFTVPDDTHIQITVPATATSSTVTVTTPSGSATSASSFVVILAPTINGFTPTSGPVGTVVTVSGTHLDSVTSATLGGSDVGVLTHNGSTSFKFTVPAGASTGTIGATNSAGTIATAQAFKVPPKVTGFSLASATRGTSIEIDGYNFSGATKVVFGSVAATTFSVADDDTINATVPATAVTGKLTVTTASGSGVSATSLTVILAPTISGFTPATGPAGTVVTVGGSNLDSVTSASVGGADVGTLTHTGSTSLKFTVPAEAVSGHVAVTNAAGTVQSSGTFTVKLGIVSFSPTSGPRRSSFTVTGSGLNTVTGVKLGNFAAPFSILSPSQLSVQVPDGAVTGPVAISNGSVTVQSSALFTVLLPPANDAFEQAVSVGSLPYSATADSSYATTQTGEYSRCSQAASQTLWWTWTAPADGAIVADTAGSGGLTHLEVYEQDGSGLAGLSMLQCDSLSETAQIAVAVTAGKIYYFRTSAYFAGDTHLHIDTTPLVGGIVPPANDAFAHAAIVGSLPFTTTADSTYATNEEVEPARCTGQTPAHSHTLWWRWTAPAGGTFAADAIGSVGTTSLVAYAQLGTDENGLYLLKCDTVAAAHIVLSVAQGEIYYFRTSAATGGDTHLHIDTTGLDGGLDSTFGSGGLASFDITTAWPGRDLAHGAAVQSDGKIVVVGTTEDQSASPQATVMRLNTNGTLDSGFATSGTTGFYFGNSWGEGAGVAVASGGGILVAGSAYSSFGLARLTSSGALDNNFGTNGVVTTNFTDQYGSACGSQASAMALQPDGKIVLVGGACGIAGIARYNSNGTLDSGFGTGGKTQVQAFPPYQGGTNASGIALDSAGKIVVVGNDGVGHPFVLRLTTSGALDSSFGSAGIVTFSTSVVKTVAIDGNDKVLVGTAPPNGLTQPNLYRVNTDGSLDTGFGTGGIATLQATPASIVLQSDGRIVVVGNANLFLGGMMNMYGVVERRLSDGSNDPAYHFGGMVPALDSFWNFGVPDGAGTVVAVGTSVPYQSAYTVGRYLLGPTS